MTAVLELADVTVQFRNGGTAGAVPAVRSVSLALEPGEIFGLVGESGSGKSTIANAVMGLLPANAGVSGSIRVGGREMTGLEEDALRRIRGNEVAMIFQDPSASLDPTWRVGDQIAETIRAHRSVSVGEAKARAMALMNEVGIKDAAARYRDVPHRFSGGQRQRIVIAAALANDPKLLIADEPTTALDVMVQAQILNLLVSLSEELGLALVLVTHDLPVVAQTCGRTAVMYAGRIAEAGPLDALYHDPRHPYTRLLFATTPDLFEQREVVSIPGVPPRLDREPAGCAFAPRCDSAFAPCASVTPRALIVGDGRTAECHLNDPAARAAS